MHCLHRAVSLFDDKVVSFVVLGVLYSYFKLLSCSKTHIRETYEHFVPLWISLAEDSPPSVFWNVILSCHVLTVCAFAVHRVVLYSRKICMLFLFCIYSVFKHKKQRTSVEKCAFRLIYIALSLKINECIWLFSRARRVFRLSCLFFKHYRWLCLWWTHLRNVSSDLQVRSNIHLHVWI